eukprot:m51a1_g12740 putative Synaptobrevin, VAMP family (95) ;mRNA; f:1476-2106
MTTPDKARRVQEQVEEVTSIMKNNVARTLDNMEKAEVIQGKTDDLVNNTRTFKRQATTIRKAMWWQNCKLWLIIGSILAVILLIIIIVLVSVFK